MGSEKDSIKEIIGKNIKYLGKALLDKKIEQIEADYVSSCNKVITYWGDFKEEDVIRELNYCTEYFLLMKEGDTIKCDCGDKEIPLFFDGENIIFKSGKASPSENDIPTQIKNHQKKCFGTCLLEEPSRHPGEKATGGNDCEPFIVGTSWLDTYNNVKASDLKTVLNKQSWLACKYMGRIMSVEAIENIDTSSMTEKEAFDMMLKWVRGEQYIPQVILDKITKIYADASEEDLAALTYQRKNDNKPNGENSGDAYKPEIYHDKFDIKIIAWTKFVNELWATNELKKEHLEIRPVLFKAICIAETRLGLGTKYNGQINIAQSICLGDGGVYLLSNINPCPYTFYTYRDDDGSGKKNNKNSEVLSGILAWTNEMGSNGDNVTNGFIQFNESNYFVPRVDEEGNILYDRPFKSGSEHYLGMADIGDVENPVFSESIKTVATHSDYPANNMYDTRSGATEIRSGEIVMMVNNQQSVDMSLYAGALELSNHGTTEKEATRNYNTKDKDGYEAEVKSYLEGMGTDYIIGIEEK